MIVIEANTNESRVKHTKMLAVLSWGRATYTDVVHFWGIPVFELLYIT